MNSESDRVNPKLRGTFIVPMGFKKEECLKKSAKDGRL